MQESQDTLHPNPQFARSRWIDLRGTWQFTYDDDDRGLDERWQDGAAVFDRSIQVPFPPESPASRVHVPGYHPIVWYRRSFQLLPQESGKRLLLHCGAIDYRAHVWLNGQLIATHEGGQSSFSVDVTNALQPDGEQVIVVRAQDEPRDLSQPRGKQDWQEEPHTIWYHRTTGIWQPIWLEPVSATHITTIRFTPDITHNLLDLSLSLSRSISTHLRLRVQLHLRGELLVDDLYSVQGQTLQRQLAYGAHTFFEENMRDLLWSPEHPNLLDVTLTLLSGDEVLDEVQSYVGLRSVRTSNGRFLLNNRPYYLRMALEQGYWPESHLAAPGDEALRREVELAKELGFNGVRIHQKVEDPRFLYWCDRLGLLAWGEMASPYLFTRTAIERFTREWLDVLARDYNHPCIVAWVPINESWGVPDIKSEPAQQHYAQALYHLTKAVDGTRPVIGNDGWEHIVSDIISIHDYAFDGELLRERYSNPDALARTLRHVQPQRRAIVLAGGQYSGEPVMLTEVGGISYRPSDNQRWFGYGTVTSAEEYLAKYRELINAILDSSVIAGFCYTQLTDTEQETNGLLTAAREPKLDPAALRAINTRAVAG